LNTFQIISVSIFWCISNFDILKEIFLTNFEVQNIIYDNFFKFNFQFNCKIFIHDTFEFKKPKNTYLLYTTICGIFCTKEFEIQFKNLEGTNIWQHTNNSIFFNR